MIPSSSTFPFQPPITFYNPHPPGSPQRLNQVFFSLWGLTCKTKCFTKLLFLLSVVQGVAGYNKFHRLILIGPDVLFCSQEACWARFCSVSLWCRPRTLGRRWAKKQLGCKSFAKKKLARKEGPGNNCYCFIFSQFLSFFVLNRSHICLSQDIVK